MATSSNRLRTQEKTEVSIVQSSSRIEKSKYSILVIETISFFFRGTPRSLFQNYLVRRAFFEGPQLASVFALGYKILFKGTIHVE